MKVELLSHTMNPVRICGISALTCTSGTGKEFPDILIDSALDSAIESGHESVLEHASFTFRITGISRACSHQLVRHRMASYSQQSQRYVKMDGFDYVTPSAIQDNEVLSRRYDDMMQSIARFYTVATEVFHVPPEDARYILPSACCTNIIVTMNTRELRHFFSLRLCNRAQWEIRGLANAMYTICTLYWPELFKGCGPGCVTGGCREKHPCGHPFEVVDDEKD